MKFIDPLSTMQYMGGAVPNHLVMVIYAIIVSRWVSKISCEENKIGDI